jgi:hypothetical protein
MAPKTSAEPKEVDLTIYVTKPATPLQASEPAWLTENTGYDPGAAKTKAEAFAMGVKLTLNCHKFFQISPENKSRTEEARAAKAELAEQRELERAEKAGLKEATEAERAEKREAREAARLEREANKAERAANKTEKPAAANKVPAAKTTATKPVATKPAVKGVRRPVKKAAAKADELY